MERPPTTDFAGPAALPDAATDTLARAPAVDLRVDTTSLMATNGAPPDRVPSLLFRVVPALDALRHYSPRAFWSDAVAGLTVAAVAIPQAMAYALVAGLPPQYGLYTAIVMTTVGALLDSSRQLINGPTNAISIAILSALALVPEGDRVASAILLAVLVGSVQTLIALIRLGDLTRYISQAVIVGFTLGAGVLLVLDQLKNLIGLQAVGDRTDHFLLRFWRTLTEGGPIDSRATMIGIGTIALVLLLRWCNHHLSRVARIRVPELLLVVVGAAIVVSFTGLDHPGGVRVVGDVPSSLPSPAWPSFEWAKVESLAPSALAIAVLGLLEAIAMAKAIAAQTGQKLDMNQQCLSEGLANVTGGFFQCFPGSGSLTRSTINQAAGAVTQWSGVFSAMAVAATVVLFAPYARFIPLPALAGILMVSAWRMVDPKQVWYFVRSTAFDARIVLSTAIAAVAVSIEFCILIGIFLSFVFYVPRAARVQLTRLVLTPERVLRERVASDPACGRLHIWDLECEMFFGAAADLSIALDAIASEAKRDRARIVVLRLKHARNPDGVGLRLLEQLVHRLSSADTALILCGVRAELGRALDRSGITARLGNDRIFLEQEAMWSSTLDAVRQAYEELGDDVCSACPRRGDRTQAVRPSYYMI